MRRWSPPTQGGGPTSRIGMTARVAIAEGRGGTRNKSLMVSSSVAQAMHLSAQGVYLISARHDQEGLPKAGSHDWKPDARPGFMPFALLGEQADAPVALWSGYARAGREPPYSEQGQATRR